jgi:hypothetical protein
MACLLAHGYRAEGPAKVLGPSAKEESLGSIFLDIPPSHGGHFLGSGKKTLGQV